MYRKYILFILNLSSLRFNIVLESTLCSTMVKGASLK